MTRNEGLLDFYCSPVINGMMKLTGMSEQQTLLRTVSAVNIKERNGCENVGVNDIILKWILNTWDGRMQA